VGQLGDKLRKVGPADGHTAGGLAHWCPACDCMHQFALDGKNSSGAQWTWDGNVENPTFSPSMNIIINPKGHKHYNPECSTDVCHYFLQNGVLQYLADCTHGLKNQRIILPPLPPHLRDRSQT
jgi:Family of unknown function (DUF6527)